MITDYVTKRLDGSLNNAADHRPGPATANNERAVLSKIMSLAVRWGHLADNPVRRVEKLEAPKGRLRFLTHEEADKLIEKAPRHMKPIIICALETGGRRREILGLRWEDVDYDRGLLFFRQTNTKNAKQPEIPMTPTLIAALKALPRSISSDYVFTWGGKPIRSIRTGFETARDRADLGPDVLVHTLRHTWASWYAQRGGDLNLLRELGGWSTMGMVQRYAHLSPGYRASAIPMMGRHAAGEPAPRGQSETPPKRPQGAAAGSKSKR